MANRISYALDLTGPSIYLDTACSSSLTALHLAIGAIERGDCVAALVGAAQINREYVRTVIVIQRDADNIIKPIRVGGLCASRWHPVTGWDLSTVRCCGWRVCVYSPLTSRF
jgi:hypothetical protein